MNLTSVIYVSNVLILSFIVEPWCFFTGSPSREGKDLARWQPGGAISRSDFFHSNINNGCNNSVNSTQSLLHCLPDFYSLGLRDWPFNKKRLNLLSSDPSNSLIWKMIYDSCFLIILHEFYFYYIFHTILTIFQIKSNCTSTYYILIVFNGLSGIKRRILLRHNVALHTILKLVFKLV